MVEVPGTSKVLSSTVSFWTSMVIRAALPYSGTVNGSGDVMAKIL
jgi:hypothetical protein